MNVFTLAAKVRGEEPWIAGVYEDSPAGIQRCAEQICEIADMDDIALDRDEQGIVECLDKYGEYDHEDCESYFFVTAERCEVKS